MTRLSVVGAGAWGTALASHAARLGHDVRMWALEPEVAEGDSTLRAQGQPQRQGKPVLEQRPVRQLRERIACRPVPRLLAVALQVSEAGSYSSASVRIPPRRPPPPPATKTPPSGSRVARCPPPWASIMGPVAVHVPVVGS